MFLYSKNPKWPPRQTRDSQQASLCTQIADICTSRLFTNKFHNTVKQATRRNWTLTSSYLSAHCRYVQQWHINKLFSLKTATGTKIPMSARAPLSRDLLPVTTIYVADIACVAGGLRRFTVKQTPVPTPYWILRRAGFALSQSLLCQSNWIVFCFVFEAICKMQIASTCMLAVPRGPPIRLGGIQRNWATCRVTNITDRGGVVCK